MHARALSLCFAALLLCASAARADIITFTDRASFNAALTSSTLITFDDFPIGPVAGCTPVHPFVSVPCTLTTSGVTFVATLGSPPAGIDQRPLLGVVASFGASPALLSMSAIPQSEADFFALFSGNAFAVDVGGQAPDGRAQIVLTTTGGATSAFDASLSEVNFFGAITDTSFTRASFFALPFGPNNTALANFVVDNVVVGTGIFTPTPEPATMVLLGLGGVTIARLRRKRRVHR